MRHLTKRRWIILLFIDREGYRAFIDAEEQSYREQLARQQAHH